jgi:hypothetical protein
MYRGLHGNLRLWSVILNVSSIEIYENRHVEPAIFLHRYLSMFIVAESLCWSLVLEVETNLLHFLQQ